MKRAEQITCLFWLTLSAALCVGSYQLKVGTPSQPGSGFLPFGTGMLLGILAFVHLVQTQMREPAEKESFLGAVDWKRAFGVASSLGLYALILPRLGYIITTFILMLVLFSVYERRRWWVVGISTLLVIGFTYLVFHHWLKVQFPSGILRIG
jgi:putative tricarboxylic transport membrane protein